MADTPLDDSLAALHARLVHAAAAAESDRELLRGLAADVEAILARRASQAARADGLAERLEKTAIRFEGTHPDLTMALMRVVKALGDMGI